MSVVQTRPSIKDPETLIDYEIHSILSNLENSHPRNYMMIYLALNTGLRNDEICGLTIECVRSFEIIPTILNLPGTIAKGGNPREIPLNPDLRKQLEKFIEWKIQQGEDTNHDAFLFVSMIGKKRLNPRDFQRILSSISKSCIGRSIHPHVLRHTFATKLLKFSNLEIVRRVLGHKNIQTTQIYLHPSSEDVSDAVLKLQT